VDATNGESRDMPPLHREEIKMVGLAAATLKHKRWRDKAGVVHDLKASTLTALSSGVTWVSVCGPHEPSLKNCLDEATPVTCIACIAKAET
jgi:hypothetical protein